MFERILAANDGSERGFEALASAISLARQNHAELHMVSVEEVDYLPEFAEEVREESTAAARRYRPVVQRAREMANEAGLKLEVHLLVGHAVRDIVHLAAELRADLIVIGARGHSKFYERMLGSRADRIVHLAPCPVLVVK